MAVGGAAGPSAALHAQGVHLVGAAAGDVVPGQLGAMEATYRAFASVLDFGSDPARALAIPLNMRVTQLLVTVACLVVVASVRRQPLLRAEAP
jgi:hypothetical protein